MLAVRFRERERGIKPAWTAGLVATFASPAWAQTTIYKLVDESGHVTYSNKPMKGAIALDLEPLTTIPSTPSGSLVAPKVVAAITEKAETKPAVAIVTPVASIDPQLQRRRDDGRRKI